MQMLSEDDLNIRDMTSEELDAAWDLWFDLAQSTNDADPPYSHGVFASRDYRPSPLSFVIAVRTEEPL
jgi:hypothetical protein